MTEETSLSDKEENFEYYEGYVTAFRTTYVKEFIQKFSYEVKMIIARKKDDESLVSMIDEVNRKEKEIFGEKLI